MGHHDTLTVNVAGGSREALIAAINAVWSMLLVEEYRVAAPGYMATRPGDGEGLAQSMECNQGTAVLVRRPVRIPCGGEIERATMAVVYWTRRCWCRFTIPTKQIRT